MHLILCFLKNHIVFISFSAFIHLLGVIALSAAAGLAVMSDDPTDYNHFISENQGRLTCEIAVCIWIVLLIFQEILQMIRYVLNLSNIY